MELRLSAELPMFCNKYGMGALRTFRVCGPRLLVGPASRTVGLAVVSVKDCVIPDVKVNVSAAELTAELVGVKVTDTVHDASGATDAGQVDVIVNTSGRVVAIE